MQLTLIEKQETAPAVRLRLTANSNDMRQQKNHLLLFILFAVNITVAQAQVQSIADSLEAVYKKTPEADTARFELLKELSFHEIKDLKKGLGYATELVSLSEKKRNKNYLRMGYFLKGTKLRLMGNLQEALAAYFTSAQMASDMNDTNAEGESYGAIADTYSVGNNHFTAIAYYNKAIGILRKAGNEVSLASALSNAGDEFLNTKKYDSALLYFEEAKVIFDKANYSSGIAYSLGNIGMANAGIGRKTLAEKNMNDAIGLLTQLQDYYPICVYLNSIAEIYEGNGDNGTALQYTARSLQLATAYGLKEQAADASYKLSTLYEKTGQYKQALHYHQQYIAYRDSINNISTVQKMADLRTDFEVSQKQAEVNRLSEQKKSERKLTISLGIISVLAIIILGILFKYYRNKQHAVQVLQMQKQQTEEQKAKAENALEVLQVTQKQLVQSAKMVSLGELTAGIAHEIQNPLNFVNNFSELSIDLLDELKDATVQQLPASKKADAEEIMKVLTDNLKKINDHGKRADSIVKGMLQHSQASTGNKEMADINNLADEYLRLSYQGHRAKDKSFTAAVNTHFDSSLGRIEIVPQDIGRLLLNIYNNAFYSLHKKKQFSSHSFDPMITVSTKKKGNSVQITVTDNGTGMPAGITDKIFQPFFTTKPTGQGTGLGLSLGYDIVKAHGGEIRVETKEGEFATFIIDLPVAGPWKNA